MIVLAIPIDLLFKWQLVQPTMSSFCEVILHGVLSASGGIVKDYLNNFTVIQKHFFFCNIEEIVTSNIQTL